MSEFKITEKTKVKIHVKSKEGQHYSLCLDFKDFNKRMGNAFEFNYPTFKFSEIEIYELEPKND